MSHYSRFSHFRPFVFNNIPGRLKEFNLSLFVRKEPAALVATATSGSKSVPAPKPRGYAPWLDVGVAHADEPVIGPHESWPSARFAASFLGVGVGPVTRGMRTFRRLALWHHPASSGGDAKAFSLRVLTIALISALSIDVFRGSNGRPDRVIRSAAFPTGNDQKPRTRGRGRSALSGYRPPRTHLTPSPQRWPHKPMVT